MDSLTHTVLGACTGELIAGKKLGKKAMLIGAIMNNLPDADMIANFWNSPASALLTHRGITHSILFAVCATPLLINLFRKWWPSADLSYKRWLLLVGHGLFLHILMDAFTTYGTGWFEPFSHTRVSFNTLFILDPFFMLPLLIGAIVLLILRRDRLKARTRVAWSASGLSLIYLLITIGIKINVNNHVAKELQRQKIEPVAYMESPAPLNNLLWYVLVKKHEDYVAGYYSILDSDPKIRFHEIGQEASLLSPYTDLPDVKDLLRFSKDYYVMRPSGKGPRFCDMRFGQIGVDSLEKRAFVFCFDLDTTGSRVIIRQAPWQDNGNGQIAKLFERVKGN